MNRAGHSDQDFLAQFFRIGVLHTLAAGQAIEQGEVNLDEFPPGFDILRVGQASYQTGSSIGSHCHRHAATSW